MKIEKIKNKNTHYWIWLYYYTIYSCLAIYSMYVPIYLSSLGYNNTQVGFLVSLYPIVILVSLPFWGRIADQVSNKNKVVQLLLFFSGVSMLLFQFAHSYLTIFISLLLHGFFFSPTLQLGDTITLECLENNWSKWKYDLLRMGGTIGYAITAFISGIVSKVYDKGVFIIYFLSIVLAILTIIIIPKIKGHQDKHNPISINKILTNKRLVIYMIFYFLIFISFGYYNSFFGIYYNEITKNSILLGIVFFIPAISEIPFLLIINKIIKKFGIKKVLILSAIITAIRWFLLGVSYNQYIILLLQFLHGCGFIIFNFAMVMYVHQEVPKELRASGQSLLGFLGMGLGTIIGTQLGGILSDRTNLHQVFLYLSIYLFIVVILFLVISYALMKNKKNIN